MIEHYRCGDKQKFTLEGIQKYTTNFTPPARTDEITVVESTKMAFDFDGVAGSTTTSDLSNIPSVSVPIIPDKSTNEFDVTQDASDNAPLYGETFVM